MKVRVIFTDGNSVDVELSDEGVQSLNVLGGGIVQIGKSPKGEPIHMRWGDIRAIVPESAHQ